MQRTPESARRTGSARDYLPAVLADRTHRTHDSIPGASDYERLSSHIHSEIVARLGNLLVAPDADPGTREHGLALELEKFRRGIAFLRQHGRAAIVSVDRCQFIEYLLKLRGRHDPRIHGFLLDSG